MQGKTYLVTGAAGGLGSTLVNGLCQHDANVIALDKNIKVLNHLCDGMVELGLPEPIVYPMDLAGATPDNFYQLSQLIESNLGCLDGIIHTAVELSGLTPFQHYEPTRWLKEIQTNLNGPVFLTQQLLPLLVKSRGSVIFTLDNMELIGQPYWGSYGVAKAGIAHFSDMLRQELNNQGVRVHSITPPPLKTALRRKIWFEEDSETLTAPEDVIDKYLSLLRE